MSQKCSSPFCDGQVHWFKVNGEDKSAPCPYGPLKNKVIPKCGNGDGWREVCTWLDQDPAYCLKCDCAVKPSNANQKTSGQRPQTI